ncbi:lipase protein [Rutstroemia sp. NJR-2017a BBW]|nr:lipase protein [Rutstroemia sp. NJR-2017a BBW]
MEGELHAHKAQDGDDQKKQDDENSSGTLVKVEPARTSTLLPSTVANAVSFVTRSSSLYIRLGTFIGGLAIDSARVTTLTGLELSRAVIEGIIHRAGKDVANRSTGEVGRLEAEGLLERSIATLHSTITGISFAASAGFHFSSAALSSATDFSQQLLGALDGILGSTDSSRAIASIITLIRREFQNPATGVEGEKVSVGDLLLGICGLALLQRWCRKLTDLESKEHRYEEVLWDVVILNDGRRADVVGKTTDYQSRNAIENTKNGSGLSFLDTRGDELLQTIERGGIEHDDFDEISEIVLKQRILESLPPDSSVTITTSTSTTKTITVEFSGSEPPNLSPPPGVEIVEDNTGFVESSASDSERRPDAGPDRSMIAAGRIVYRIVGNKLQSTLLQGPPQEQIEAEDSTADTTMTEDTGFTPATSQLSELSPRSEASVFSGDPFPPVLSRLKRATSRSKIPKLSLHPGTLGDEKNANTILTALSPGASDNLANQKRSRKPRDNSSSNSSPDLPSSIVPAARFKNGAFESSEALESLIRTGFEDVLADMTCDYDELVWRGKAYKVHMGIHASARRLLDGGASRVIATLKAALEEFPHYGLVMCGHSLGGGVSALLAVMISEPAINGTSFVTSHNQSPLYITNGEVGTSSVDLQLPPGRPVHVYAYGPPATMSPSLRLATRGLITTIVNGQDLVPYLSLGLLHDLQAVALAFKNDDSGAKGEVKSRVWTGMSNSFSEKWYGQPGRGSEEEDDKWAYSALKALRASMLSTKLLPPGEVFMVEAMPVLKRNAFTKDEGEHAGLGKPATRSILKYVRDVEKRFGEVRFGGSMLLDHSPGRYESSLGALARGVLDTDLDVQY